MRNIIKWLTDKQLKDIYTSLYWNNIEEEKEKPWWIEDGDYGKCIDYLKESTLLEQYELSERYIKSFASEKIKIADLASGIGWTSALLSKLENVSEVHAVEISRHRLDLLFPHSVKMLQGDEGKINRYLGSFYDLKFDRQSIDIVYLSQAFHHADNPYKLLQECDKVLKKKGRIILVGEHHIGMVKTIRRFLSNLIRAKKIEFNFYNLFKPDEKLGDHYYRQSDYYFMFQSMGYKVKHKVLKKGGTIYIADKLKI